MTAGNLALARTLLTPADFDGEFPDESACLDFLKDQKYPSGLAPCARCGRDRRHHRVRGRRAYACAHCGSMISPMKGTIFEKSSTPLRIWFYAIFRVTSADPGIRLSARQLQRETGVTYKTAWRMLTRIRALIANTRTQESTPVEPRRADARVVVHFLRGAGHRANQLRSVSQGQ
jgi:transposase